jgi:high affinity sulfate transporter 1
LTQSSALARLVRLAPGLPALLYYRRADLPRDLVAGLSVAAVALPVGVAYAQLAGFHPVVGLYASILPLVAYALFGTSRQLIVGPDAATCALVAAAVAPLAAGNPDQYLAYAGSLAFLAGLLSIGASFLRLGAIADFLSKPILVGFLNGVSLHILVGQLPSLFGFSIEAPPGIVIQLLALLAKIDQTHWLTLGVGVATFAVLRGSSSRFKRLPAPLVALVFGAVVVAVFGLDARGVAVVGAVPPGLPELSWPAVPLGMIDDIAGPAAGIALVSFSSMMLTARSFAAKNRYTIDVDREFAALGAANIAAGLSQGFAVSGTDSRTAVSDASGGRTQVTGLIAAATIACVLLFFTDLLRYVPVAALGAILVNASLSLLDFATLRRLRRLDRAEFVLSMLATLGVIWFGAIEAIVVVLVLALLRFVRITFRPRVEVLGRVEGLPGHHALDLFPSAQTYPGLALFRFNAPLVFFNAPYFKHQALSAIAEAGPGLKWFVIDALPVTQVDVTGIYELEDLQQTLRERNVELVIAGSMRDKFDLARKGGLAETTLDVRHFPTIEQAVQAFQGMGGRVPDTAQPA